MSKPRSPEIRALTLHQPKPAAICHLGKDVENCLWPPPQDVVGGYLAIHAGKVVDVEEKDQLLDALRFKTRPELNLPEHFDLLRSMTTSSIVAVARLAGVVKAGLVPGRFSRSAPGPATVASTWGDVAQDWQSPWFTGPFGMVLVDVVVLANPITCKGQRGFWHLNPGLLVDVRAEYARSRSAA